MTVYGKPRWRRRLERSLRVHTRYWVLIGVGLTLVLGAGTALAAIVLQGRGTLVAPALDEQQLQVTDERLSTPLTPGGSSDLLFAVRNPNPFPARVDRVSLASPMSKTRPAGCTAKVSGPVQRGYTFPAAERVSVPAGGRVEVTVPAAFKLAGSASKGCGFTVDILVNATQATSAPVSSPPTATAPAPQQPTTPATTRPADSTTAPPPPSTELPDEDPLDGAGVIPPPLAP